MIALEIKRLKWSGLKAFRLRGIFLDTLISNFHIILTITDRPTDIAAANFTCKMTVSLTFRRRLNHSSNRRPLSPTDSVRPISAV